jgi:hypothetical protein
VWPEGLGTLKQINDLIGTRTHDNLFVVKTQTKCKIYLILWSRALFEISSDARLLWNSEPILGPEDSSITLPEQNVLTSQPPRSLFKNDFNIFLPSTPRSLKQCLLYRFQTQNCYMPHTSSQLMQIVKFQISKSCSYITDCVLKHSRGVSWLAAWASESPGSVCCNGCPDWARAALGHP